MSTLLFDTSCPRAVVGVARDGVILAERTAHAPRSHAEKLAGLIDEVLTEAQTARSDIARIVVGRGPGSFIGTRVALSTAAGWGQALDVPLVGVCTLLAVAGSAPAAGVVLAVLDARKSEAYIRRAETTGRLRALDDARAVSPAEAAALAPDVTRVIGATALLGDLSGVDALALDGPTAAGLWRAAEVPDVAPGPVILPNYCRAPDAKRPA